MPITPGGFSSGYSASGFYVGTGVIEMTHADVMARFRAVLEADPLFLTLTTLGFSHDNQPVTLVSNTYYLEDGGIVDNHPVSNKVAARIDQIKIYVALRIDDDPHPKKETLETTLVTIERYLLADGLLYGYHPVVSAARRVTQKKGAAFYVGSLAVNVDYDFDEAVA